MRRSMWIGYGKGPRGGGRGAWRSGMGTSAYHHSVSCWSRLAAMGPCVASGRLMSFWIR